MKVPKLVVLILTTMMSLSVSAQNCHWVWQPSGPAEWVCDEPPPPVYYVTVYSEPDWNNYAAGDVAFAHLSLGQIDAWYVVPGGSNSSPPVEFGISFETGIVTNSLTLQWLN